MRSRGNSGCAMLILIAVALSLLMWALTLALYLLGGVLVVLAFVSVYRAIMFAKESKVQVKEQQAALEEFEQLKAEASADLATLISQWDLLVVTRGIGTDLQDDMVAIRKMQTQLFNAKTLLDTAADHEHTAQAINMADDLRYSVRRFIEPTVS